LELQETQFWMRRFRTATRSEKGSASASKNRKSPLGNPSVAEVGASSRPSIAEAQGSEASFPPPWLQKSSLGAKKLDQNSNNAEPTLEFPTESSNSFLRENSHFFERFSLSKVESGLLKAFAREARSFQETLNPEQKARKFEMGSFFDLTASILATIIFLSGSNIGGVAILIFAVARKILP
jgi:hypothetical protein